MRSRKPKKKTSSAAGAALTVARNPQARNVAFRLAKLGVGVGGRVSRRKARREARRLRDVLMTLRAIVATYAPEAIQELEQLGVIERPKQKRMAPRFVAGAVTGAGAMYLLAPASGREHRRRLQRLISG